MEPLQRTKLTVQFAGSTPQWNADNLELPVEVRRLDSALVGRTLATGSLDVGPGSYVVRAVAEGGEFAGLVEVPPGQREATVMLRFFDQPLGQPPDQSRHFRPADEAAGMPAQPDVGVAKATSFHTCDLLEGHLFSGRPLAPSQYMRADTSGRMRIAATDSSVVLRVQRPDRQSSLITPVPQSAAAHLAWEDASSRARLDVHFHLDHPQAQLLLGYLRNNALADARLAAQSTTLTAAQLLRGKQWDPLAGALGAYVLLRQEDNDPRIAEELDQRSAQLCKYNRTFPDALCIRSECLARAGEHRAALDLLLELSQTGTPLFTAGWNIAAMRLTEYLGADVVGDLDEPSRTGATVLLRRLRWLGLHAVPGESIVKFANFDPGDAQQYQDFWRSTAE